MLEPATGRRIDRHTENRRRPRPSGKQFPATPALVLPSLENIPHIVHPDTMKVAPSAIEEWAKMLLMINPDCMLLWQAGTRMDQLGSELLMAICNAVDEYAAGKGLTPYVSYEISGEGNLSLYLSALEEHMPVFYKETLEKVRDECPRLFAPVRQALILLGHITSNWEDVKGYARDYFEFTVLPDLEECGEKEELKEQKAFYEEIKKTGPRASPFKYRDREVLAGSVTSFKRRVERIKAVSDREAELLEWLNSTVKLLEREGELLCLVEDYDDCHIHHSQTLPIYHSRHDSLTQYHCEELDNYFNSGSTFGTRISLNREAGVDIGDFLNDIETLALYQKVFGFF